MEQAVVDQASPGAEIVIHRDKDTGRFMPGASGNPRGRPPALRQEITDLQEILNLAVHKELRPQDVVRVLRTTLRDCENTDYRRANAARKLIFDYFIRKPSDAVANEAGDNSITIKIENATFKATHEKEPVIVDGEVTEVTANG